MQTIDFLHRVLPERGLYVAARLTDRGFRNSVCQSIEELAQQVLAADAQGVHAYHACAAYREESVPGMKDGKPIRQVRTHGNVRAARSFYMDLDVESGNDKKFATQEAALDALMAFCDETMLPLPMIISSGGGIHTYWAMVSEVQPETWRATAEGLKALAAKCGFKADPACTSDMARVLRPVGTWNRKHNPPTPVELIADAEPLEFHTFNRIINTNLELRGIEAREPVRQVVPKQESINQAFAIKQDFPPCSGVKVADRCAQLAKVRDTKGCVTEPHWYAAIQLLCHSVEGDDLIHAWSNGHAQYSPVQTSQKIIQIRSQSLGPTLCGTFADRNPGGCDGCTFRGKISSPAQLGTHIASAPAPTVQVTIAEVTTTVTLPLPPHGFTRGEGGGIYVEEDGITHKVYDFDCFPVELAHDEQLGYETMRWRHFLPKEGWKECVLQSSLVAKPADFIAKLIDNHIHPLIKGKFVMYGDAYIRKLRNETKLRQLFKSQGWKNEDKEFVLGDKLYRPGETVQAGFSHGMGEFLAPFHAKGALEPWVTLTEVFDHPGFEPHAFMLLLAFAAPLFKLAGREGCTINALGDSGVGKSTMAQFMSSVYGSPKGAWVGRKDTELARMQRLGAHYNLPVYMDEATTIEPKDLRDMIYAIPTGKNRSSMKQDYTLRKGAEWVTLFVTSTNNSLQAKLQLANQNAEAESLRLFEFKFPRVAAFAEIAKIVPSVIQENYGLAGEVYVRYLVENRDRIRDRLARVVGEAEQAFSMNDKERFWSQVTSLALYGGELAREAGVILFDPNRIRPWLLAETRRMRDTLDDSLIGPIAILANFLNEHIGERLVVSNANASLAAVMDKPHYEISQRYDIDSKVLWISRKRVKYYLDKHHFNFAEIEQKLIEMGVLLEHKVNRTLGAGTNYASAPTQCWKINAAHDEVVGVV